MNFERWIIAVLLSTILVGYISGRTVKISCDMKRGGKCACAMDDNKLVDKYATLYFIDCIAMKGGGDEINLGSSGR